MADRNLPQKSRAHNVVSDTTPPIRPYSPGPWHVTVGLPGSTHGVCDSRGRAIVCRCDGKPGVQGFTQSMAHANARLMAAAPDLLAALTAACAATEKYQRGETPLDPWYADAKTAIAKATGGTDG